MRRLLPLVVMLAATWRGEAQTEVKTFTLATGEILVFTFKNGIPEPSTSVWAVTRGAGPAVEPEGKGFRMNWVVDLLPRRAGGSLANVTSVVLQEVSGKEPIKLFSGPPEHTEDGLLVFAPAQLVTRFSYPWLYSSDPTILVFRLEMTRAGAKPDLLIQPVLIGPEVKKQLKERGYLP